ncbi:MAG: hypothetical protein J5634_00580, partial [Bacilli bacterium]|nr:hypothetical protein [Bacilli bacterium]
DKPDNPDKPVEVDDKYSISPDTIISSDTLSISNLNLIDSVLTLTIKSSEKTSLDQYYFELFDENNTLLKRIKVSSDTIDANTPSNYSYKAVSTATKISVVKKTANDYPAVSISYDDAGEGRMVCKNESSEHYTYVFSNDELLKIVYTYNKSSSASDYENVLETYSNLDTFYKSISGLISTLINNENGFDYSLTINLNTISIYDLEKVNLNGKFKVKTSPKEIKFKLEASNFTCTL